MKTRDAHGFERATGQFRTVLRGRWRQAGALDVREAATTALQQMPPSTSRESRRPAGALQAPHPGIADERFAVSRLESQMMRSCRPSR